MLTCLISPTAAAALTPLVVTVISDLLPFNDATVEAFEWTARLALIPGVLLLASSWLVQTWDENRWPRLIELLLDGWRRLASNRNRPTDSAAPEARSRSGWRVFLRPFGLSLSDEMLPAWRREARRLLWLEWRSAWWVCLGLMTAASVALLALLGTAHSQADMRFVMATLPVALAFVAFAMGVWSFQGQQREQRFRFFAAQGTSPNAMWLVKHVVWLSIAVMAVLLLVGVASMVSVEGIGRIELDRSDPTKSFNSPAEFSNLRSISQKLFRSSGWLLRLVFLSAYVTGTSPAESYEVDEVIGSWPLVSLLWLSLSRGVLGVWLCFAIGQLAALVIPRAVTALMVGLFPLGVAIVWWFAMSFSQVPLLIAVCPVLLGVLAAEWGRMNDWLEERSGWRRWLRVAATLLVPMLVAFVGMAAYRVYEIPEVAVPVQRVMPTAYARQTGEDWMRLAEQLDSPFARPAADGDEDARPQKWRERLTAAASMDWEGFEEREWLAANAPILEQAMQLSQRADCVMPRSWEPWNDHQPDRLGKLALLIKMSAIESLANHRLDEALQRALVLYRFGQHLGGRHDGMRRWQRAVGVQKGAMHVLREWAMSSDQTEESLLAALGRSNIGQAHPVAQLVRAEGSFAVNPLETLQADYSETLTHHDKRYREVLPAPFRWMFWEQAREERLLNVLAQEGINNLNHGMTRRFGLDQKRNSAPYGRLLRDQSELLDRFDSRYPLSRGGRWLRTSTDSELDLGWGESLLAMNFFPVFGSLETQRRGLWLTIALQAYRVKHGRFPDRLDDLVGRYLDRLPSDPLNGLPFEYRPNGYPFVVLDGNIRLAENTPVIVASGEFASRRELVTAEHFFASEGRRIVDVDKVWLPGDLMWVSMKSHRLQYGEMVPHPYFAPFAAFSLKPSF